MRVGSPQHIPCSIDVLNRGHERCVDGRAKSAGIFFYGSGVDQGRFRPKSAGHHDRVAFEQKGLLAASATQFNALDPGVPEDSMDSGIPHDGKAEQATHESRKICISLKFRVPFNETGNGNPCTLEGEGAGQGDVFTSHDDRPVPGFYGPEVDELLESACGENSGRPGAGEHPL